MCFSLNRFTIHQAVKHHMEQGQPTYLYYYDFGSVLFPSMYRILRAVREDDWLLAEIKYWVKEKVLGLEGPHEFGETHANDLLQLWNMHGISALFAGPDKDFSTKFVKSFVDIACGREPLNLKFDDVPWPPEDSETSGGSSQFPYILIGTEPKVISEPLADIIPFWKSLREKIVPTVYNVT